jgi:ketosteroid isomerase-like protein
MIYRWFVRKQSLAVWAKLSDQRIDEIPLADDVHFVYLGDHSLATDRRGAEAEREWLRELFRRLPGLRFEVEDMIVEGGPWSTRVATRYAALQNGQVVYRGVNFGRVVLGQDRRGAHLARHSSAGSRARLSSWHLRGRLPPW